jgi:hypothetical protein
MQVVAKFYCESVEPHDNGANVIMRPDYPKDDAPDHPNRGFWEATPSGSLQMFITNMAAMKTFEPGQVYTVTFDPDEPIA